MAALDECIVDAVRQDYPVTLRGVFYRVVSAGCVDKTEAGYQRVGRQLLKLRRTGVVPYAHVTDGTRWIRKLDTATSIEERLLLEQRRYRRALWRDQPDEVLIFTEKDAISGVILPVVDTWDVPLGVLRGYSSESFAYSAAATIVASNVTRVGTTFVYQLGDHDPSGVDAWRDFTERVTGFIADLDPVVVDWVHFERLAVTEEQIHELGLPTRPTKRSDTRAARFSGGSVEVDAIPAPTLRALLNDTIEAHVDPHHLEVTRTVEAEERAMFARFASREFIELARGEAS